MTAALEFAMGLLIFALFTTALSRDVWFDFGRSLGGARNSDSHLFGLHVEPGFGSLLCLPSV